MLVVKKPEYLRIRRVIAHLIDPRRRNGYRLSERELPVTYDNDSIEFLERELHRIHVDSTASGATFINGRRNTVSAAARRLQKRPEDLVQQSIQIAEHLHGIVDADKRISGAVLVVCLYSVRVGEIADRYLGVLKLDPSRVFRPAVRTDDKGASFVTLESLGNVLPATGDRLQKGASIALDARGNDELRIVDNQRSQTEEPAKFFTTEFLGARVLGTTEELLRQFVEAVVESANEIRERVSHLQAEKAIRAMENAMRSKRKLHWSEWIETARLSAASKSILNERLGNALSDDEVVIDNETTEELLHLRTFAGRGYRCSVERDFIGATIAEGPTLIEDPERGPLTELVLMAKNARETR